MCSSRPGRLLVVIVIPWRWQTASTYGPFEVIERDLSLHGCTGALSPSSAGRGCHVLRPGRIAWATALSPALNCRRYLFGDSPSSRAARRSGVEARRKEIACCCSLDRPASRSGGRPGPEQRSGVSFAWWTCSASSLHRWCEQVARGSPHTLAKAATTCFRHGILLGPARHSLVMTATERTWRRGGVAGVWSGDTTTRALKSYAITLWGRHPLVWNVGENVCWQARCPRDGPRPGLGLSPWPIGGASLSGFQGLGVGTAQAAAEPPRREHDAAHG